jgi:hypothetical protein
MSFIETMLLFRVQEVVYVSETMKRRRRKTF